MTVDEITELLSADVVNNESKDKKDILNLPFIKKNKNYIVFWSVKPSGDYVKDYLSCHLQRIGYWITYRAFLEVVGKNPCLMLMFAIPSWYPYPSAPIIKESNERGLRNG